MICHVTHVAVLPRNSENNTPKYPDIVARLPKWLKPGVKSLVFDGEAVAWDAEKKKILPFQVGWLGAAVGERITDSQCMQLMNVNMMGFLLVHGHVRV